MSRRAITLARFATAAATPGGKIRVMDPRSGSDSASGDGKQQRVLEQSPVPIVVVDAAMRVIDCNEAAARLAGSPRERIVGLHLDEMMARAGALGRARDLEQQIERSQRMEALGQLAASIAHDFNNLLTVIAVEVESLREGLGENAPLSSEVEAIRKATNGAAALTRQLLAFGARQVLRQRRIDLNELVTETVRMVERLLGKSVEVVTRLEPRLPPILGDPGQLEQVLVNLAVNARDAMPDGGVLTITTERAFVSGDPPALPDGEYVVLTVADTGHGMDESVRRRMFDAFFTTKLPGRGTGLGLSTVRGIVERAGGAIAVASEPGRGTRFRIHLPRAP
ncbi:MAG TPA: ATP-binding protein [Gemmatimonadaceae bacterium]|nr:ATP-binding protein [Gemmatimonadaceae bacterium]